MLFWDKRGDQRITRRLVKAQRRAARKSQQEDYPEADQSGQRQNAKQNGEYDQQALRYQQETPSIEMIRKAAADSGKQEECESLRQRNDS